MIKELLLSMAVILANLLFLPLLGGWILSQIPAMKYLLANY